MIKKINMMEKLNPSNSSILEIGGKKYWLKDLPKEIVLTEQERIIIFFRQSGLPVLELEGFALELAKDEFLKSAVAITGFQIAEGLWEELKVFLADFGFGNLNLGELQLSLRMNAAGMILFGYEEPVFIECSGKFLNLNFLAKVLKNYGEIRQTLDKKLKKTISGDV